MWADNHYYVRYVVDLRGMGQKGDTFPSGNLTDHIAAAPSPLCLPLGLERPESWNGTACFKGGTPC